jgi:hypothetical protein
MANSSAAFGLQPITSPQGSIRANKYGITATAGKLHLYEPVARDESNTLVTAVAGTVCIGSIVAIFDADGVPVGHYPGGSAAGYMAMVADDPQQEFVMKEDGDTTDLALVDGGLNVAIVDGTDNDDTGFCGAMIDSDSKATTASLPLRLVRMYEDATNELGDYCKWVVRINNHQNSPGTVGVAL